MRLTNDSIAFSEDDLKEVFALFSSPSAHELNQAYDSESEHHFRRVVLSEEYELTEETREFAIDSLRAVLMFLHRAGYRIEKDGNVFSLAGISEHFV